MTMAVAECLLTDVCRAEILLGDFQYAKVSAISLRGRHDHGPDVLDISSRRRWQN